MHLKLQQASVHTPEENMALKPQAQAQQLRTSEFHALLDPPRMARKNKMWTVQVESTAVFTGGPQIRVPKFRNLCKTLNEHQYASGARSLACTLVVIEKYTYSRKESLNKAWRVVMAIH